MYTPQPDKVLHHAAGTWAAFTGQVLGVLLNLVAPAIPRVDAAAAVIGCALGALGREMYNVTHGGAWSNADIVATLIGGAPVVAATL